MYVFKNALQLRINPSDVGIAGDSAGGALAAAVAQKLRDDGGRPQFRYQILIYPLTQGLSVDLPSYHTNEKYNSALLGRHYMAEAFLMYIGENRSLAPLVMDGYHTTSDIWQKYGQILSLDNLHLDIPQADFVKHYGIKDRTSRTKHSGISHDKMKKLIHPYAFPLMAESMKDLPPALVITCESDTLRDDGILYAQRLRSDGVKVLHYHKRDCSHGFMLFVKSPLWLDTAHRTIKDIATFVEKI